MAQINSGSRLVDALSMCGSALISGWSLDNYIQSVADYQAQAEAITHQIYSAAQTITPEVVEQANQLISQNCTKPDSFEMLLGVFSGVVAFAYGSRWANKKNYEK